MEILLYFQKNHALFQNLPVATLKSLIYIFIISVSYFIIHTISFTSTNQSGREQWGHTRGDDVRGRNISRGRRVVPCRRGTDQRGTGQGNHKCVHSRVQSEEAVQTIPRTAKVSQGQGHDWISGGHGASDHDSGVHGSDADAAPPVTWPQSAAYPVLSTLHIKGNLENHWCCKHCSRHSQNKMLVMLLLWGLLLKSIIAKQVIKSKVTSLIE